MLRCPFCNSETEVKEVTKEIISSGTSARNIQKVKDIINHHGTKIGTMYIQTQYIVRCSDTTCIGHSITKKFWSIDEASEAWNRRSTIHEN